MKSKYIYAMASCGFIKVGISENPKLRARSINTPDNIDIWHTDLKYSNSHDIEKECHRLLSDKNIKGEWFDCSLDVAKSIINSTSESIGIKCDGSDFIEKADMQELISTIYNEELITGTILRRNQPHRMIFAELVSTYDIDWINEGELRLLITDDELFESIKIRLKK